MIDLEAVILGHPGEHHHVMVEPVKLGDDVTVGARAILFPGVQVGDWSTIGANALVPRGTIIPPDEVWAGVPARKLRDLPRSMSHL